SSKGGNQGIGFAIPIDLARDIMQQLIENKHIVRGYLGIVLQPTTEKMRQYLNFKEANGVYVQIVSRNSPAQKAGIMPGDIITKINNVDVTSVSHATNLISNLKP